MPGGILLCLIVGVIARWLVSQTSFAQHMKIYPHFTTPLNDVRELKEALYMYKKTGNFYSGPTSVGQSELLLKLLYILYTDGNASDQTLYLFIAVAEAASTLIQLVIMNIVYSASPKKSPYLATALIFILFNPI